MNSKDDDVRYAITAVILVVLATVVGVLSLAIYRSTHSATGIKPFPTSYDAGLSPMDVASVTFDQPDTLYFAAGSDSLPGDSDAILSRVAETVRSRSGFGVLISSFVDETDRSEKSVDLAKRRAAAVRHALEAYGVEPERLVVMGPTIALGDAGAGQAQRIELRFR